VKNTVTTYELGNYLCLVKNSMQEMVTLAQNPSGNDPVGFPTVATTKNTRGRREWAGG